jgi:hypothetical protein
MYKALILEKEFCNYVSLLADMKVLKEEGCIVLC